MSETLSKATQQWLRGGTVLAALFPRVLPASASQRLVRLTIEGALAAAVSLLLTRVMAGEVVLIAVFFTAAGLVSRLDALLEENRNAIWMGDARGANVRTATSLLALFVGVFAVYVVAMTALGEHAGPVLAFAERWASFKDDTILTRQFGSFSGLLASNLGVWAAFAVVSIIYRSLGALLVLSWNAGLWAVTLSLLMRRALGSVAMPKALFFVTAWVAVLPHLLLEAAAYTTASLAAIYLSRALLLYPLGDDRLGAVARAALRMVVASLALLVGAALAEALLPGFVLGRLAASATP